MCRHFLLSFWMLLTLCQMAIGDDLSLPECSGCIHSPVIPAPAELPPLCESCVTDPMPDNSPVLRSEFPE